MHLIALDFTALLSVTEWLVPGNTSLMLDMATDFIGFASARSQSNLFCTSLPWTLHLPISIPVAEWLGYRLNKDYYLTCISCPREHWGQKPLFHQVTTMLATYKNIPGRNYLLTTGTDGQTLVSIGSYDLEIGHF